MKINDNISFQGKPGPLVINYAQKEFGGDLQRVKKYANLFDNTFSANIDKNTVVDLNSDNKYIFSNTNFPGIKYISDVMINIKTNVESSFKNNILQSLLMECPKIISRIETNLFRDIVVKSLKQGKSVQDLYIEANKIENNKSKKNFLDNLNLAELIIKENPNSELTKDDFDFMNIKLMEKEANKPGSDLYNLIHSFEKGFDFTN